MSLLTTVTKFARSPQGRRALQQAKARLDTPENRRRATEAVSKVRSSRTGRRPSAPGDAPQT